MAHNLQDTISLLSRTPAMLNALLRDQPEIWTLRNEGNGTWNPFDVVGHLAHGERTDWMPRVKCILQHGEDQAFQPFDRFAQERESREKSLPQLLDEFSALRSREPERAMRTKLAAGRSRPPGPAPFSRNSYAVRTLGDLGGTRSDSPAPTVTNHGAPVPRDGRPMEPISWRPPVPGPQLLIGGTTRVSWSCPEPHTAALVPLTK